MGFSIIVPVYNVELYIEKCIQSVLAQEYKKFELILINDGSLDNSGEICDMYSTKDSRIKVINKKNGGLSDARNAGMKIAKEDNVIFLDSDDYLTTNILFKLANLIDENEEIDLITCTHNTINEKGLVNKLLMEMKPLNKVLKRNTFYDELSSASSVYWSASANVFKRKKITENKLKFRKKLIGAEDCDFFMNYVRLSNDFVFCEYPIINYRINREGSITTKMSKDAVLGQLVVFSENYYMYQKTKNENMKIYFSEKFANTISLLPRLEKLEEIRECVSYISNNKAILKNTNGIKYNIANLVWKCLGYYKGSIFLGRLKSILELFINSKAKVQ